MGRLFFFCIIFAAATISVFAQNLVSIEGGKIQIDLPKGFKQLTKEEISLKYPNSRAPQYVYATETASVSIGVSITTNSLAENELDKYKTSMEELLPRAVPNLKWLNREIIKINNKKWVHFELISSGIDTDIHNHLLTTSLGGNQLLVTLNATVKEYLNYKEQLEKVKDSILIKE
jgi:hypothetical protein